MRPDVELDLPSGWIEVPNPDGPVTYSPDGGKSVVQLSAPAWATPLQGQPPDALVPVMKAAIEDAGFGRLGRTTAGSFNYGPFLRAFVSNPEHPVVVAMLFVPAQRDVLFVTFIADTTRYAEAAFQMISTLRPGLLSSALVAAVEVARTSLTDRSLIPPLWCDRTRVQQVLSNLVANALKFVPAQGTIRTRVWAQADEMHFEVGDTGPGISEPELSHLFERYWTDRRRGQGVGLGLFISKGIVEAHGRRIFVESEIGRGTTFHFTIPASSVAAHATASGH